MSCVIVNTGLLTLLVGLPFLLSWRLRSERRWIVPLGLALIWLSAVLFVLAESARVQTTSCGPSLYSLVDAMPVIGLLVWLPVGGTIGLLYMTRRRVGAWVVGGLLLFAGGTTMLLMDLSGWAHEDTQVSAGFSWREWRRIELGMTRTTVYAMLGPPLDDSWDTAGGEAWVTNRTAGHFAVVWFTDDRVTRAHMWSGD
jgi:hypothetical protein